MKSTVKIKASWAVQDVTYNDETQELIVHMQHGTQGGNKKLKYSQVPKRIFEEFLKADSKGKYFNSSIRNSFPYDGEV